METFNANPSLMEQDNRDIADALELARLFIPDPRLPAHSPFETQVLTMLTTLKGDMHSTGERVASLEVNRAQSATIPHGQTQSVNLAKTQSVTSEGINSVSNRSTPLREVQNSPPAWMGGQTSSRGTGLLLRPVFDDEDEDQENPPSGVKLFKTSQKTEDFLKTAFSVAAPNQTR